MRRFAVLPAVLMAAGLAGAAGCKTTAPETKTWSKADALPFDVSLDGQPAVFKADAAGPIKAVNGPVGIVEAPVAADAAVKLAIPEGWGKARSILVEIVPLDSTDKSSGASTVMKLEPSGEGKLQRISAGGSYAMAVTVTPEKGAPMTSRLKFKTKTKAA